MTSHHDDPQLTEIADMLRAESRTQFGPGFADRVMRRIAEQRQPVFADVLASMFGRIAAAALILILLVGATTVWRARTSQPGRSPLDVALGLPEVSLEAAYALQAP